MRINQSWILTCPLVAWGATIPSLESRKAHSSLETRQGGLDGTLSSGKAFSLAQTENGEYQGADAPFEMIRAHAKYGVDLSSGLAEAVKMNPDMSAKWGMFLEKGQFAIRGSLRPSSSHFRRR